MKIAILGYGIEGKSIENYFTAKNHTTEIFDHFDRQTLKTLDFSNYDLVFRSPSVPPLNIPNLTSATRYFFDHCPAKIIAVTGTKGKGTTCSLLQHLLVYFDHKTHLVGNIGTPALSVLDKIKKTDLVIYELSSFQAWDLHRSPHIAIILRIEPDHLDVHSNYQDYLFAKSHITRFQTPNDHCIYYADNPDSLALAHLSSGTLHPYPQITPSLQKLLSHLSLIGKHNQENAAAALLALSLVLNRPLEDLLLDTKSLHTLKTALSSFSGLPHRLELVRELKHVRYYDDNFSSAFPALDVALSATEKYPTILIAGGKDRHLDLTKMAKRLSTAPNLQKIILIGETASLLARLLPPELFIIKEDLSSAVHLARDLAEPLANKNTPSIVLMSPGFASFDMFRDFRHRGETFQKLVHALPSQKLN